MLNNIKLSLRLNLILVMLFTLTIVSCSTLLSFVLEQKVEREVESKASLAIETMSAVRSYTSDYIQPELSDRLILEQQFLPETVPAYAAKKVFTNLRENTKYRNFSYKEAALNPTNLKDKADEFEATIVEKFRQNDNLKQLTGFQSKSNNNFFYIARPLKVNHVSCLQCHSLPKNAPPSLIATYGDRNGFNWRLNEVVASQIVYVPAKTIWTTTNRLLLSIVGIIILCFFCAIVTINIFIQNSIIKPLTNMSKISNEISLGSTEQEFSHFAKDEIGTLAKALNRMRISLVIAMERLDEENKNRHSK